MGEAQRGQRAPQWGEIQKIPKIVNENIKIINFKIQQN